MSKKIQIPWSRVLLENIGRPKDPSFHLTRRFTTWSQGSVTNLYYVQDEYSPRRITVLNIHFNIILLHTPRSYRWALFAFCERFELKFCRYVWYFTPCPMLTPRYHSVLCILICTFLDRRRENKRWWTGQKEILSKFNVLLFNTFLKFSVIIPKYINSATCGNIQTKH